MKTVLKFLSITIGFYVLTSAVLLAQESCIVLKSEIDSAYLGSCKKDLANGIGEAWGQDHYYGEFKKGYPHGNGVYEYQDGSVYTGDFFKGLRHGEGEYHFSVMGADTSISGIWADDRYIGEKPVGPGYKVIRKINVERYRVYREGDGSRVTYKFMSVSTANSEISDVISSGSSGNEFNYTGLYGFENIQFPFSSRVRFQKWNKLATARLEVSFEIEISQPGSWRIEIY